MSNFIILFTWIPIYIIITYMNENVEIAAWDKNTLKNNFLFSKFEKFMPYKKKYINERKYKLRHILICIGIGLNVTA